MSEPDKERAPNAGTWDFFQQAADLLRPVSGQTHVLIVGLEGNAWRNISYSFNDRAQLDWLKRAFDDFYAKQCAILDNE
jgi:hypothetical protein